MESSNETTTKSEAASSDLLLRRKQYKKEWYEKNKTKLCEAAKLRTKLTKEKNYLRFVANKEIPFNTSKICKDCKIDKLLSEFHFDLRNNQDGRNSICKECKTIKDMSYRVNNRKKCLIANKKNT